MSCRKCKSKCICEPCPRGPRGFSGITGPTGPSGAAGPTDTEVVSALNDTSAALGIDPTIKAEAASFYDNNNAEVFGIGDVIAFRLPGPNDPITTPDGGFTFILPRIGLYRIDWQMAVNEPTPAQLANPPPGGAHVQTTLTTQAIPEGAFVPVPGGRIGRDAPFAQVVGNCILVGTIREDQPVRIENTGTVPISFVNGPPANPNERSINIANLTPPRRDAIGAACNQADQLVPPNGDVSFDSAGTFVNVAHPPAPFTQFEVEIPGRYQLTWAVQAATREPDAIATFYPFVNGVPIPISKVTYVQNAASVGVAGFNFPSQIYAVVVTDIQLQQGDLVTLRNVSRPAPGTFPQSPPLPGTSEVLLSTSFGGNQVCNATFEIKLTNVG